MENFNASVYISSTLQTSDDYSEIDVLQIDPKYW